MAEENGGNGAKRTGLIDRVREDAENIKTLVREKGKEEIEGLKDPEKTQLYRSIFRVKHEETPRSRSLGVLSNVTTTRGAWAESPSIFSLCSPLRACC
jgi:hypothetical protein